MKKYYRFSVIFLVFSCWLSHVATAQVVNVPDANLAMVMREAIGLAPNAPITKQHMQNIRILRIPDRQIKDLTGLEHATRAERLDIIDNQVSNLSPLAGLTQLQWLDLGINQIRDVRPLSGLTQLRVLSLGVNQISDIRPLTGLTKLVVLDLAGNQIGDVRLLAGFTQLERLFLSGNRISDVNPLTRLTRLKELHLIQNDIRDVSALTGLINLEKLYLADNPITDTSPLASLTKLVEVDVEITAPPLPPASKALIPDPNLAAAVREALGLAPNARITKQAMQGLTTLFVHSRQIKNITGLEHATKLETLSLNFNQIRDIRPLTGLTQLKVLWLTLNQISDLSPLAGLTKLKQLWLGRNQISDLSPLAGLIRLEDLILIGNKIRDVSPLAGLVNLEKLWLKENPIRDTAPLASLTKLVEVDVEITAPLPDTLPEDPLPEDSLPEDSLPEDPLPPPEREPEPETPAPLTITAGQITFSELMYATSGGLFSQPQWIELYNNAPIDTEPVNLRGSRLVIEARDSETRHRYSVIKFGDLHIAPNWTVLLVTRGNSRDSGYLSEDRVYNLYDHSNVSSLGLRENAVLPASGFAIKLLAADGTLVDTAGNLDGKKRSKDTPAWELPPGWTEDRARTSLIRRYEAGVALPGTEAMSWVSAADVQLAVNTYYGRETDVGTPGYRRGGPLPVELSTFHSEQTDAGVSIEWITESETDNAGFNILRAQTKEGAFVKVNPTLIPGAGTTTERNNYTWTDTTAKPNVAYYYQIEDVSFSGDRQSLATVRMRGYVSASDKLTAVWGELKVQD